MSVGDMLTALIDMMVTVTMATPAAPSTAVPPSVRPRTASASPGVGDRTDSGFVAQAVADGLGQIDLGKVALDRASSEEVRSFARIMIDDHLKANAQLAQMAARQRTVLPTEASAEARMTRDSLRRLSGREFDCAYSRASLAALERSTALFIHESAVGRQEEVRGWTLRRLPALKRYRARAREIEAEMALTP